MLVWSRWGRLAVWAVVVPLFLVIYGLPIAIIGLASISGQWNGILPSSLTFAHYADALRSDSLDSLKVSILTGAIGSASALVCGTWAALALRGMTPVPKRVSDLLFFIPSAVPSVSVGLAMLVAFSRPPLLLNGTLFIVLIAHFVLISAFAYGNVSAGLARIADRLRAGGRKPGRAAILQAAACDAAAAAALSRRRPEPELCAVDGRTRCHRHGVSARMGHASGPHLLIVGSRRDLRRRHADDDFGCRDPDRARRAFPTSTRAMVR